MAMPLANRLDCRPGITTTTPTKTRHPRELRLFKRGQVTTDLARSNHCELASEAAYLTVKTVTYTTSPVVVRNCIR